MKFTVPIVSTLTQSLQNKLSGFQFAESYSSGKDELWFVFKKNDDFFSIKLIWQARSCFLFFDNVLQSKPVPHQVRFSELNALEVISVCQHQNNRSFQINFSNHYQLVFKLYDGLSNVLLFKNDALVTHFRTNIKNDSLLKLSDFENGKEAIVADDKSGIANAVDVFETMSKLSKSELSQNNFDSERDALLQKHNADLKRLKQLLNKTKKALLQIQNAVPNEEIGHLIMANLHLIKPKEETVELFDFYRNNKLIVKLKKDLNAQQNAEHYYRKSKNQKAELELIANRISETENRILELEKAITDINNITVKYELKKYTKQNDLAIESKPKLFYEFEFEGFIVLAGKSAANNDLLTMKHSSKNDLWLHAKGVSGSHVVIKFQSGKIYSKALISFAASIAAFYSKAKGSKYVPVVYTQRKNIYKPKGAEPGSVVVEKEEVIMAEPQKP